jgi:hypothetical protein
MNQSMDVVAFYNQVAAGRTKLGVSMPPAPSPERHYGAFPQLSARSPTQPVKIK